MTYILDLTIKGLPKRINQGHGASWRARHGEARKWLRLIADEMVLTNQRAPTAPLKKAKLTLTRFSSQAPDFDGLTYSFKFCVDALRKLNIIEDDNMKVIGAPEYKWAQAKIREGRIHIRVEEITPTMEAA